MSESRRTELTTNSPMDPRALAQLSARVFWLMFAINVVNYLDRFIVVAVGPALKAEFGLHDRAIGLLSTAFILVYTLAALPLGLLADSTSRARVVAVVVGLWSAVSALTAFARSFFTLFVTRALVGVGEAGYYPAGTALLSAYFPFKQRAKIMSRWQAGQLVGVALAFLISALLFTWFGQSAWRLAFLLTGLPGLLLAVWMWRVPDVPPGTPPLAAPVGSTGALGPREIRRHIGTALHIPTVRLVIVLQALVFAIVTPAVTFLPIYLVSHTGPFHVSRGSAALLAGAVTVFGGVCGMLLGGWVADRLSVRYPGARVLTAALGFALALPCYIVMLASTALPIFVIAGLFATLALNLQAGPLTAAVQDATPPALRGTAVAIILLLGHLLGDVWAPTAVGAISTALHERTGVALLVVGVPILMLATLIALLGARVYALDIAKRAPAELST
ncbi:MAG TPA: MFS transporter [Ktedonobacterales bacterium]